MFKVNSKDTTPCSSVFIVNFEQVNSSCVRALTYPNKLLFYITLQCFNPLIWFLNVDTPTDMELRDFLEEISLMKMIGFHKNIVNFIGCSTILKPFFLVLELMEHGDLLHFLRKRRAKVSVHASLSVLLILL